MAPGIRLGYPMYCLLKVLRFLNTQDTMNAQQPGPGLHHKADRLTHF